MNEEDARPTAETQRALKLWVVLARCYNTMADLDRKSISRFDLIPTEFGVLEMLHHKGPLPLSEIGRRLLLTSGSITYVVDKLEKRRLVERIACPNDRRVIHATLTTEGSTLIASIFPSHAEAIRKAVSGLNPDEQEIATVLLRKLGLAAEGGQSDPPEEE